MNHHHGLGVFAIVAAIAFVFGKTTARVAVGAVLVIGALAFLYIAILVITGAI